MPEHHVTWEIDGIEADSREDAARQCREMLLDPANTASIFYVEDAEGGNGVEIDTLHLAGLAGRTIDMARVFEPVAILKMLDLSTAHLPENVCQNLNDYPGVTADERSMYGWLGWVPEDIDAHLAEYNDVREPEELPPSELVTIWRYAQAHGCKYVLLDRDANLNPDLPTWEW